jgi:hypothetical protein
MVFDTSKKNDLICAMWDIEKWTTVVYCCACALGLIYCFCHGSKLMRERERATRESGTEGEQNKGNAGLTNVFFIGCIVGCYIISLLFLLLRGSFV